MPKITPFLWFDDQAEEAASFYVSLFEGSRVVDVTRYGEVTIVSFELAGQRVTALNGGPTYRFTEAFSFAVDCEDQAEVDRLWAALTDGGEEGPCGWLKDRYGLSWQVVPQGMEEILGDPDPARAERAVKAMLGMKKLDVAALRAAADGA